MLSMVIPPAKAGTRQARQTLNPESCKGEQGSPQK